MNKKQFLLVGFLLCGLMQQNIFSRIFDSTSTLPRQATNDKEECKVLREAILAVLHQYHHPYQYLPVDRYQYVRANISMFEALKCSRFENNF
ncbi:MAG: hypothetical protein WC747_01830 [Candidatus Babeliales bacterium]|jgi:hypothetical protein